MIVSCRDGSRRYDDTVICYSHTTTYCKSLFTCHSRKGLHTFAFPTVTCQNAFCEQCWSLTLLVANWISDFCMFCTSAYFPNPTQSTLRFSVMGPAKSLQRPDVSESIIGKRPQWKLQSHKQLRETVRKLASDWVKGKVKGNLHYITYIHYIVTESKALILFETNFQMCKTFILFVKIKKGDFTAFYLWK